MSRNKPARIGLSARIFHPEPDAQGIRSKTLQVLEQSVAQWVTVRDAYEMELLHEFMEAKKPVLGICRGMQLINVALGGSLFQDLPTQCPGAVAHESGEYDRNAHSVAFAENSQLVRWFGGAAGGRVASIHHQAINRLGRDLAMEAHAQDGVVEAIRGTGRGFVFGVQWHPEFHQQAGIELLDCAPILEAFLAAARP